MKLLILVASLLVFLGYVNQAKAAGRYLIVSPRVYRNGSTETVSVTFYKVKQRVQVTLQVWARKKLRTEQSMTVEPWDTAKNRAVSLKIPSDAPVGSAQLKVTAKYKDGKVWFSGKKKIDIKDDGVKVFIQTDKPIYKPGETIRFRVIAVKPDLKPVNGKLTEVYVKNPGGTRMVQWKNVALDTGFTSMSMKLSVKPVLGTWSIEAKFEGKVTKKQIKVDKYVLPKIEVAIKAPSYLLFKRETFEVTVCSRYTYGKPAKGKVEAKFCLNHKWNSWRSRRHRYSCMLVIKEATGCVDVPVLYTALGQLGYTYGLQMSIQANFTEKATGLVFSSSHNITKIEYRDIKMNFDGTPAYFKPGFPIVGQLAITTADGRPDIGGRKVTVTARTNNGILFQLKTEVTNGMLKFDIDTNEKMKYIRLEASYAATHRKNVQPYYRVSRASKMIKAWFSRSKNYLLIEAPKSPIKVGSLASINVKGIGNQIPDNTVSYSVFCRGDLHLSGTSTVKFSSGRQFSGNVNFAVTFNMVPKCRLLVYYARDDGELIADSLEVDTEETYENQVSVKFSDSQQKPGGKVSLEVQAVPGSRFALAAIDKSVELLAKNNDLKSEDVIAILAKQDVGPSWSFDWLRRSCHRPHPWHRGRRTVLPYRPDSRYVDSTEALKNSGVVYISNLDIDIKPCPPRIYPIPYFSSVAMEDGRGSEPRRKGFGGMPGPRPFVRKFNTNRLPKRKEKKKRVDAVRVRKEFPETWLWSEEFVNEKTGKKTIQATVPDTLTTWYANAFAMSKTAGLGVAKRSSLLVFQPFFVSLALPYSVIRGEKVDIPAVIFNYEKSCLSIKLTLDASDAYDIKSDKEFSVCVCSDSTVTKRFKVVPKKLGSIPLTVKAISVDSNVCGKQDTTFVAAADAVTKKLLVEAEGIKKESTFNAFFCLKDSKDTYKKTIRLGLPDNYVPGSVYATMSVFGDLMGPSLTGIDKLLAMPYGCGEQNMLKFAPNIYILDYLTNSGQLTSEIKARAIEFMISGYQRELRYKRKDGSYSAFGNRDKEGSTWLTAFVLRSFGEAKRYIEIDQDDLVHSRQWLLKLQTSDGCFKEVGMVHHRDMKGGVKGGITMTAFVLIALLETGMTKSDAAVTRALSCITKDLNKVDDPYTAAILAYTLTLAGSTQQSDIMKILKKLAKSQDGMIHWEGADAAKDVVEPWYMYRRARSADIEMTAYALMAYLKVEPYVNAVQIIRWLAKQRNSLGGFSSTQDTCVALQALSKNAKKSTVKGQSLSISAQAPGTQHTFKVTNDNKLLLQWIELPTVPADVMVNAKGIGCALLQANVKFNEEKEKPSPAFDLLVEVVADGVLNCRHQLKICTKYNSGTSNMALIDVKMVSGFEPVTRDLDKILQSTENQDLKDYEFIGNLLSLYFNEIGSKHVCIKFAIEELQHVEDRKPSPIVVYDYYDKSKSATRMHNVQKCPAN